MKFLQGGSFCKVDLLNEEQKRKWLQTSQKQQQQKNGKCDKRRQYEIVTGNETLLHLYQPEKIWE